MKESGNSSDVKTVQVGKVYTGLNDFKVVGINPSLEAIREKINPNAKDTAADYLGKDKNENVRTRIDFYLTSVDKQIVNRKISFWVTDKEFISRNGEKYQFIDDKTNTAWAPTKGEIASDYINKKTARKALMGESQLMDFLKTWMNINTRAEDGFCALDDPKKLANGDVSELKAVFDKYKGNTVKLLAVARINNDNSYQDFYRGYFGYSYITKLDGWKKALNNEYTALQDNEKLENFLEFVEYIGASEEGASTADVSSGVPATTSASADDVDVSDYI